jgi:hypothetical protein
MPEQAITNLRQALAGDEPAVQPAYRLPSADEVARSMLQFLEETLDFWS